jgi:bifunctional enzyme CysN/CysC
MAPFTKDHLRVVIVGHVDHGKSTLIGRLLHDTNSLPDGKLAEIEAICEKRGTDALEWSFVLDSFQAERDQAITIDTTQIHFSSDERNYVIIDAPGHRAFLKNMISGASSADAAILVVDADEGVQEQTRRHAYMLSLLGLKQIAVVLNKMDKAAYDQNHFERVSQDVSDYLSSIGMSATTIIPISARNGDMIANRGSHMDWFTGDTVIDALDRFGVVAQSDDLPLRFPAQDVYRHDEKRIIVGRIETGELKVGDELLFSPINETAKITSIESWPRDKAVTSARAGQSIGITLDHPVFVERGQIASHIYSAPMLSNVLKANIFWLSEKPLKVGNAYKIRYGTFECTVTVQSINKQVNTQNLEHDESSGHIEKNAVAEVTLRAAQTIPIDPYTDNEKTGRLVMYDGHDIVGGGTMSMDGYPDQRVMHAPKSANIRRESHLLDADIRAKSMGHYGGVFWFTGLSGAGKTTTAMAAERLLVERGYNCYVLDGDNLRHGINRDLGFSPDDRAENIRRVGEIASLMARAGLVVITSFISPYKDDRDKARQASPENFHEIFVKADIKTCETRDEKGLYKKARAGEIDNFTGINAPYESPDNPELVIHTDANDPDTCVNQVVKYIEQNVSLSDKTHVKTA